MSVMEPNQTTPQPDTPQDTSIPAPPAAEPPTMPTPEPSPSVEPAVDPASAAADPPTPPASQEPAAPAAPTPSHHGLKRILLVEDDDSLASVYVTRLEAEGFDVHRVGNGEDALATALSYHPDLVVLDVMMPQVSGFDVLDILRNTPETANLKVIMLTALSQASDQERAKALGADDYLVKSQVVIADVVDRIRQILGS